MLLSRRQADMHIALSGAERGGCIYIGIWFCVPSPASAKHLISFKKKNTTSETPSQHPDRYQNISSQQPDKHQKILSQQPDMYQKISSQQPDTYHRFPTNHFSAHQRFRASNTTFPGSRLCRQKLRICIRRPMVRIGFLTEYGG